MLLRPSYVIMGEQGNARVYDEMGVDDYITHAVQVSPEHPVLIDRFMEDAIEIDVDAICDGKGGIYWRHYGTHREADIHSGTGACSRATLFHRE